VNDKTVVAVGHAETMSDERGAPSRVVIDSLRRWRGKRLRPVQISEVEAYLALTARRYNGAKILADPWQAAGMIQRLQAQGVRCEAFPFTTTSTGRIGQSLHLALRNRLLSLPNDDDLLSELGRVRLRETGIGQARLDHDSGDHDDQAVAIAIIVSELIGKTRSWGFAEWMESEHPRHACGQPNPRASTECTKCHEPLTPPEPEATEATGTGETVQVPWSPWSPIPDRPGDPQTTVALRMLEEARWAPFGNSGNQQEFGPLSRRGS
jgi:hypothetical protein